MKIARGVVENILEEEAVKSMQDSPNNSKAPSKKVTEKIVPL